MSNLNYRFFDETCKIHTNATSKFDPKSRVKMENRQTPKSTLLSKTDFSNKTFLKYKRGCVKCSVLKKTC